MRIGRLRWIACGLAVLALFAVGCSDKSKDDEGLSSSETDEQALVALVSGDVDVDDVDSWAADETGGGGPDEPIVPLRWARVSRMQYGLRTHAFHA
jgi:hypothetical protein